MAKEIKTIVVIARHSHWERALVTGVYTQSTINSALADVGFIHCSFPDQTIGIVNRKFTDEDDLMLLLVDAEKVNVPVKYEGALSGRAGVFPHIYGPLNVDAVYATAVLEKDSMGNFVPPNGLS
jgi:uncharacterized protein (DUF952 family)